MASFKSIVRSLCPPLIWRGLGRLRHGPEPQPVPQEIEIARFRHMPGATPTVVETLLDRPFRTAGTHLFLAVLWMFPGEHMPKQLREHERFLLAIWGTENEF